MKKFKIDKLTLPMFGPSSDWAPASVSSLPSWAGARRVAVDVETFDPDLTTIGIGCRRTGYVVGVSFAIEDGPAFYLPVRHAAGGNLDPAKVFAYLKDQAQEFRGDIVGAHLPYDIDYLAEEGVEFHPHRYRDVQVAEPLLDEHQMSYSLEAIAGRHGLPGKDEYLLREAAVAHHLDPKKDIWRFHSKFVGPYAEQDVRLPLQLIRRQEKQIEAQDLDGIYDLECQVLPVLVKMRRRGVRIDMGRLEYVEDYCRKEEQSALDAIYSHTNIRICIDEINQKTLVARAMDSAGLEYGRTPTGQPKIDAAVLKALGDHPVALAIKDAKKFNKVRGTFAASIRRYSVKGRIHCTFNQLRTQRDDGGAGDGDLVGAGPGRLSCVHPNLQQQPSKGKLGMLWRSIFAPDDLPLLSDTEYDLRDAPRWAAVDFSSQEPRMAVHYAYVSGCRGAEVAWKMYQDNPRTDFHGMTTGLAYPQLVGRTTDDPEFDGKRKGCKVVFLGLVYSMGGAKLCRTLGYTTAWKEIRGVMREVAGPEGQKFLDGFHQMVPWLREFVKKVQRAAKDKGHIKTILGRHCHIKEPGDERKSPNNLIQGSSADQVKKTLVLLDEAGLCPQISVHDENDTTIYCVEQAREIARIMETSLPMLTVPSICDVEVGTSWGDSMGKKL